jgi:hypothetical protein
MPAKTILTVLFLISLGVIAIISRHALPQRLNANTAGRRTKSSSRLPPFLPARFCGPKT